MRMTPQLERLSRLLERGLTDALKAVDESPGILHDAIQYCVFPGGKRFRPLLCLAACAVELIHTYSLVHDDLPAMDNAATRRGQPSCHKKFGEATAILVGDALLTLAFEHLGASRVSNLPRALSTLGRAAGATGLIGGQMLDLETAARGDEASLKEIARKKTGALIEASAVLGGLAAGAPEGVIGRLYQFGERVGLAFQLIDDLHDGDGLSTVTGAEAVRRDAAGLLRQAVELLAPMGRRAESLRHIALWLGSQAKERHVSA